MSNKPLVSNVAMPYATSDHFWSETTADEINKKAFLEIYLSLWDCIVCWFSWQTDQNVSYSNRLIRPLLVKLQIRKEVQWWWTNDSVWLIVGKKTMQAKKFVKLGIKLWCRCDEETMFCLIFLFTAVQIILIHKEELLDFGIQCLLCSKLLLLSPWCLLKQFL